MLPWGAASTLLLLVDLGTGRPRPGLEQAHRLCSHHIRYFGCTWARLQQPLPSAPLPPPLLPLLPLSSPPQRVSSLVLHLHLTRVSSLGELLKVHQSRRLAVFLLQLRKRWREEQQQLWWSFSFVPLICPFVSLQNLSSARFGKLLLISPAHISPLSLQAVSLSPLQ